jgi:ribonucleoside-diphosphate reductase alpha chain
MEAVERDGDFDLVNPRDGEVAETIRARDLFSKIVEGAWLNGEPGVVL